jgi:biopolymer transport protein ExbD
MGLKKRNKVSAEFSMSSLTDIIFLLLIFFMLTSSLIQINMDLPQSNVKTVAPTDIAVTIEKDGFIAFNGRRTSMGKLEGQLRQAIDASENKENATVTIVAELGVEWQRVSDVMKVANRLNARAIIATEPREG